MSRQNRVDPEGGLIEASARGTLMGNRGCLHDDSGKIVRQSARDAWVTCLLSFKDRRRQIMQPGHYTELFFLDEATALAAGHRPCSECRRGRYVAYLEAWARAFGIEKRPTAKDIDQQLKRDRSVRQENMVTDLSNIPSGVIVKAENAGNFHLVHHGRLHLCGDFSRETSADSPPVAPRVGVVANMEADTVLQILIDSVESPRGISRD